MDFYVYHFHAVYSCRVVDGVINLVMSKRPAFATLSRAHAFYTNVSMLEEFFPALVLHQKQAIQSLKDSQERFAHSDNAGGNYFMKFIFGAVHNIKILNI